MPSVPVWLPVRRSSTGAGVSWGGKAYRAAVPNRLRLRKPQRYGFVTTTNCWPAAPDVPAVFRRLDTLSLKAYDSITLHVDTLLPAYAITIDTTIRRGDTLYGVEILRDTELTREFTTLAGCDSTLTVRVTADFPDGVLGSTSGAGILVYPNPARSFAILRSPPGTEVKRLTITDVMGRRRNITVDPGRGDGLLLDLRGLPRGTYILRGLVNGRPWSTKLLVLGGLMSLRRGRRCEEVFF